MKRSFAFFFSCLATISLHAQSVTTDPVGFTTTSLLGNSDSFISLPFVRPPAFVGGISSASGTTITVAGNPWIGSQFVYAAGSQPNHYYALVGPATSANPKEGHTYAITGNTTNSLTVQLGADTLTGIPANAQVSVIPNWTLATAFPTTDQNVSFTPTTSSAQYKTQVRVPDVSAAGINLPYLTYFFSNNVDGTSGNVGWRAVGNNTADRGDDALLPDSHFVVRNLNGAPTLPLVTLGGVITKKVTVPLVTSASTQQDNPVGLLRPLDVSLNATGLKMSDGSFTANDQLLLFNNAQAGYDKSPSAVYVQSASATNGPWRLMGDTVNDRGNEIILASTGFVIRKGVGTGQPAFWTNNFPVQATSVVSRKTHGAAGDFDINLPLSGLPGVESRSGGVYKVIFTFPAAVTFSGAAVTSGVASTVTPSSMSTNVVAVDLTGVTNNQYITVTLLGVNDGTNTNDVAARMGVLVGDANGNGSVTSSDIAFIKSQSGLPVSASNFRADVNAGGSINASDVGLAKSNSGAALPPDSADGQPSSVTTASVSND
ncbi:MAG: TIGR02597 family protein [Chthoniobacterales bacterium]